MAEAHVHHQGDLDRMRVQLQHLCKENERLLACEQQWQNERQMLHMEQKQLQSTCQALARQLEDSQSAACSAAPTSGMSSLSQEMAQLQLKAADQEALHTRLQELEVENETLRRACAQQRATIAQRNLAGSNGDKGNALQIQDILNQAQAQMSSERQNYEKALEDMNRQIQKKDEEMASYQAQLKLFNDDFHAEHRERERANSDVKKLREELEVTKELLNQYTSQQLNNAHQRREESMQNIREQYYRSQHSPMSGYASSQPYFRQRGAGIVVCDGEEERAIGPDEDVIDSLVEPENPDDGSMHAQSSDQSHDSLLQCPKCMRGYPVEQHSQFLEHIDECTR